LIIPSIRTPRNFISPAAFIPITFMVVGCIRISPSGVRAVLARIRNGMSTTLCITPVRTS
jgi:hypothetical protein